MEWHIFVLTSFCVAVTLATVNSSELTGNTITYWSGVSNTSEQCIVWGIECDPTRQQLGCCRYDNVTVNNIEQKTVCSDGWTDNGIGECNMSLCGHCNASESCSSDGVCQETCGRSYCYPGTCVGYHCQCSDGFYGDHCEEIKDGSSLFLGNVNFTMWNIILEDGKILTMATNMKNDWWTNQNNFNRIMVSFDAAFFVPTSKPREVTSNQFMIYDPKYSLEFIKESTVTTTWSVTYGCRSSVNDRIHCRNSTDYHFDKHIDHNDRFRLNISATFGGRKNVFGRFSRYSTFRKSLIVSVGFDLLPPVHCSNLSCNHQPLYVKQQATPTTIHLEWNGWSDPTSGINQYVISVYKLYPDPNGNLRQSSKKMSTCYYGPEITESNYPLTEPGVYSFILTVIDKADNRMFARRFAIFDPSSKIDMQTGSAFDIVVTTGHHSGRYIWQASKKNVNVTWKNHFINEVQSNGHFLSKIIPDPFHEGNYSILPDFDDHEGVRSLDGIPNKNGITKFEIVGRIHGKESDPPPTQDWRSVGNLTQYHVFQLSSFPINGDTYKVWIKAHDIMNHTAVDSVTVHFDNTAPNLKKEEIHLYKNVDSPNKTFVSRVTLQTNDEISGIYRVRWTVLAEDDRSVLSTGYIPGNSTSKANCDADQHACRCDSTLESCYFFLHVFEIDHCNIRINPSDLEDTTLVLRVEVYNPAMLSAAGDITIGKAVELLGVGRYPPPKIIRDTATSIGSTRLEWEYSATCYNITGISISYGEQSSSGRTHVSFPPSTQSLNIVDLTSDTEYVAEFSISYGNKTSATYRYSFKTKSTPKQKGMIAGLVIVCLVAFVLLLGVVYMKRRHNIATPSLRLTASKRSDPEPEPRYLLGKEGGVKFDVELACYDDASAGENIDNIYEDLHENVPVKKTAIKSDTAVLESLIGEGNFTNVYFGSCELGGKKMDVAFKCPSPDHSGDKDITDFEKYCKGVMRVITKHNLKDENILLYHGVIDEKDFPKLLMEYCAEGALDDWLRETAQSDSSSDIELLESIVRGIVNGMEFLAVKKVFHGSLTSFNVLLTSNHVPKLKGLGESYNAKTNIKWTAPERIFSMSSSPSQEADVWSFGVVLWEVFSLGEVPFEDITDDELPARLHEGLTLGRPALCSGQFNAVLTTCLLLDKKMRPTFMDIVNAVRKTESRQTTHTPNHVMDDVQNGDVQNDDVQNGDVTVPTASSGVETSSDALPEDEELQPYSNEGFEIYENDENIYDN